MLTPSHLHRPVAMKEGGGLSLSDRPRDKCKNEGTTARSLPPTMPTHLILPGEPTTISECLKESANRHPSILIVYGEPKGHRQTLGPRTVSSDTLTDDREGRPARGVTAEVVGLYSIPSPNEATRRTEIPVGPPGIHQRLRVTICSCDTPCRSNSSTLAFVAS